MLHLVHEKINYTFVIFGVNLWGGGGVASMYMYDEKYGRPICGYSSLFYCFLGNLRLPLFFFGPMLKIESPDSFSFYLVYGTPMDMNLGSCFMYS